MDYAVVVPSPWLLYALSAAIFGSAVATIVADATGWRRGVYLFKPLTTLLILALALMGNPGMPDGYQVLIAVGLAFSLVGDVFLMLPTDRFVAGLVSFLFAHIVYLLAFGFGASGRTPLLLLPLLVWGVVLLVLLWPRLGKLRIPVIVYAAFLLLMAWQAWERAAAGIPGMALAALGAGLFVVSDSALALDRFRGRFRHAQALVLGTYFAAQWLIALSTWGMYFYGPA